jgi:hypothetical protein
VFYFFSQNTIFPPYVDNFAHEIENHIIAEFSVLELNLTTKGHVFGAFVVHILGLSQIRGAIQRLKVSLISERSRVTIHFSYILLSH